MNVSKNLCGVKSGKDIEALFLSSLLVVGLPLIIIMLFFFREVKWLYVGDYYELLSQ